ncbi:efflux RND transporter periplasmic adaptor subunit [Alphaproteobacteria bacterium]|nr:efflux RND transporter periplasmic adaptor subunit [Alphaproteobacteria bacterium]MDC1023252.1 efflux RND transporter periplasmic adaptor subunit [Alphaproteobacteria bacterium]
MISKIFNRKLIAFVLVLIVSVISYKYLMSTKPQAKLLKVKEKTYYVNVVKTIKSDYSPTSDAFGKIVSSRKGDLRFGVSGKVEYVSDTFLNGSFVKNEQVLAKLDQKRYLLEIERFKAETQELKIQLEIRKRQVKRYKSMLKRKVISQNKYDNELILFSKNNSDYIKSKTILNKAREDLSDTILKAKFNGRLYNIKINKGQFISSHEKIANIFSIDDLEVEFLVPAKVYSDAEILIGKSIEVIWESGIESLKKITAVIKRTDGKINEEEGGGKLFAKINQNINENYYIPVGSFVRIKYPQGDFKGLFKLPETSLYGNKVYIVENNIAKERKVSLKFKGSGFVLVEGNFTEDDLIVSTRISDNLHNKKVSVLN